MYWLCDVYDNTASNYKKQNDVIEIIQENERFIEWLEKKQLIEIKKNRVTSSNNINWSKVIQSKRERITESNANRLREWRNKKEH